MRRIAVDIDGVLANLTEPLLDFCNLRYCTNFEIDDLYTFDFKEIFNITPEEESNFLLDFFNTDSFEKIQPLIGSQEGIKELYKNNSLNIVTARPEYVKEETCFWLKNFYKDSFENIHFTDYSQNIITPKSDLCLNNGYNTIIEDDLRHANLCAEMGIETILITHPWNKNQFMHSNIKRVEDWNGVLRHLK